MNISCSHEYASVNTLHCLCEVLRAEVTKLAEVELAELADGLVAVGRRLERMIDDGFEELSGLRYRCEDDSLRGLQVCLRVFYLFLILRHYGCAIFPLSENVATDSTSGTTKETSNFCHSCIYFELMKIPRLINTGSVESAGESWKY